MLRKDWKHQKYLPQSIIHQSCFLLTHGPTIGESAYAPPPCHNRKGLSQVPVGCSNIRIIQNIYIINQLPGADNGQVKMTVGPSSASALTV